MAHTGFQLDELLAACPIAVAQHPDTHRDRPQHEKDHTDTVVGLAAVESSDDGDDLYADLQSGPGNLQRVVCLKLKLLLSSLNSNQHQKPPSCLQVLLHLHWTSQAVCCCSNSRIKYSRYRLVPWMSTHPSTHRTAASHISSSLHTTLPAFPANRLQMSSHNNVSTAATCHQGGDAFLCLLPDCKFDVCCGPCCSCKALLQTRRSKSTHCSSSWRTGTNRWVHLQASNHFHYLEASKAALRWSLHCLSFSLICGHRGLRSMLPPHTLFVQSASAHTCCTMSSDGHLFRAAPCINDRGVLVWE